MKLIDIIYNVNKSDKNFDRVYIGDFADRLYNLVINNWEDQNRLTCYFIGNWYCTDTVVGYRVYFFDDKPVAVSTQSARKSDEKFEWITIEKYNLVKEYVLSFYNEELAGIKILNPDEEHTDTYTINYYSQLLKSHKENALYNNKSVRVIKNKDSYYDVNKLYKPETVCIQFTDGKTEWVEMKDLTFKFYLK